MNTKLDHRGWNTANERFPPRPQKPQPADPEDLKLTIAFYVTCVGFLVAGIAGLSASLPIWGIG